MAETLRQRFLKSIYPLFLSLQQKTTAVPVMKNEHGALAPVPFYSLDVLLASGKAVSFESLRGKKVLLVNTASDCGYTPQYAALQTLYRQAGSRLEILAFPANDFKAQESGSDASIAQFCAVNYGIEFPLVKKTGVIKSAAQHPVYQWLTHKEKNGWNEKAPSWNFAKYLVNEAGVLTHYFEPSVSPLGKELLQALAA